MSGHSHAKTIRHQKALTDQKRGQMFSKLARVISVAVREGGPNPETNSKLRLAFEMAKEVNMPKENIERAIKRASGEAEGEKLEEVLFEAYGPGGIAIIIEGITDNKNRTLGEIKQILNQNNGKLVGEGSVKWMFERRGCLTINAQFLISNSQIKNKEELEILAIEAGAEDIYWNGDILDVYTKIEELEKVKKNLEEKGVKIESASLDWVPKEEVSLDEKTKEACQKLFETLDENDAVQEIYSNLKV
jgi:YebC/PmpR family DNA-binding regulatory protein